MPRCQNCGNHVTPDYARVFTPTDVDQPRVCPNCPDKIRVNGHIRDARATRWNDTEKPPNDAETEAGEI